MVLQAAINETINYISNQACASEINSEAESNQQESMIHCTTVTVIRIVRNIRWHPWLESFRLGPFAQDLAFGSFRLASVLFFWSFT